ncbi:MAG: hypothetical protein K0R38_2895 [Polyangiaceae bacterium]|jgi:hypothetical protein|nr:hypothetical protein [Polyangiaceae bacterium]
MQYPSDQVILAAIGLISAIVTRAFWPAAKQLPPMPPKAKRKERSPSPGKNEIGVRRRDARLAHWKASAFKVARKLA